jgi:hypothetical protein
MPVQRPTATPADPVLDRELLRLSDVDTITVRQACEGIFATGSPGSGKSSTFAMQVAMALLRAGCGGLVLMAKTEEKANWIRYAKEAGRSEDLIIFSADSNHRYDPIFYEFNRPGRGGRDLESVIDMFSALLGLGKPKGPASGESLFWDRASEQLIRVVLVLLSLAAAPISISSINEVIQSLPTRPGEFEEAQFQQESFCAQVIGMVRARKDTLTPDQWKDLGHALDYAVKRWPSLDERLRGSIEMTFSGMASKFLFSPLNALFCSGECTFLPEHTTYAGKIILVDFPLLEYGLETGRLINVMMKLAFQRAWLRRDVNAAPNATFLFEDESQYYILGSGKDNAFQQTCRGARIISVSLTQNIMNIAEALGETTPGAHTKAWLGNLAIKASMQQNCVETCTFMADQIGKKWSYVGGYNANSGSDSSGVSATKQLVHQVDPIEFSRLQKPDADRDYAECLIYFGGTHFNATKTQTNPEGLNHLKTRFYR